MHSVNESTVSLNFKTHKIVMVNPFKGDATILRREDTRADNYASERVRENQASGICFRRYRYTVAVQPTSFELFQFF